MHVHSIFSEGLTPLEDLAQTAKDFGYSGFCFTTYFQGFEKIKEIYEEIERVKQRVKIEILLGIEAKSVKELKILADKRKKFDVLLVKGGNLNLNRIACETPEVDILTHPELNREDSGLNHVLVKSAAKNDVSIEINFREVMITSKRTRTKIISNIYNNVKLAKKYGANLIICSGAISSYELKDPYVLTSFGTLFDLSLEESKNCLTKNPESIIQKIKQRKSENWVMPGVEIIKRFKK